MAEALEQLNQLAAIDVQRVSAVNWPPIFHAVFPSGLKIVSYSFTHRDGMQGARTSNEYVVDPTSRSGYGTMWKTT